MNPIPSFMDSKYLVIASAAGFVLMLIGFIGYVAAPSIVFQSVFIVGVVILAAGYALIYILGRKAVMEYRAEESDEDENGFFYILDEDYSAPVGDATIEDLSKRE